MAASQEATKLAKQLEIQRQLASQVPELEQKVYALETEANEQTKAARTASQKLEASLKEAGTLQRRIAVLETELEDARHATLAQGTAGAGAAGSGGGGKSQAELDAEWRATELEQPESADERMACEWVARRIGTVQSVDIGKWLHDGRVLCSLMNAVHEGIIRTVHAGDDAVQKRKNIEKFITACQNLELPRCVRYTCVCGGGGVALVARDSSLRVGRVLTRVVDTV